MQFLCQMLDVASAESYLGHGYLQVSLALVAV